MTAADIGGRTTGPASGLALSDAPPQYMHTNSPLQARAPGPPTPRLGDRKAIHELEEVVKLKHEESDGPPHLVATQSYAASRRQMKRRTYDHLHLTSTNAHTQQNARRRVPAS